MIKRSHGVALLAAGLGVGVGLAPLAASAQTVGNIVGEVYDSGGTPLPGVKVIAESPKQIGGPRTVYTNPEGVFRFTGLVPGRFTITATAPKMKKFVQQNISVNIDSETNLAIIMEVETETETVVIKTKANVVNTKEANVKEVYDEEFLNNLPVGRSYQSVFALAPGVSDDGTGNPNVRGGTRFNNSYTVDGIDTTDPVSHTFGTNFAFEAIGTQEVQTAAFGAENATTTGGVTNVVTKSGGNKVELDSSLTYTDQNLRFFKDQFDTGTNRDMRLNFGLGGPIMKDKIWFFVSASGIHQISALDKDPNGIFPDHPPLTRNFFDGFGKLTWQISPRNKLQVSTTFSPAEISNTQQSRLVEPEAESRQYQQTNIISANWESLLKDNLFLRIRGNVQRIYLDVGPQSCQWDPNCANVPGSINIANSVRQGNFGSIVHDARRIVRLNSDLEWFKDTKGFGNHDVTLGFRGTATENPSSRTVPGDAFFNTIGTEPYWRREYCANDPSLSDGVCRRGWLHTNVSGYTGSMFLQDAWKPTRYLTINPGAALHGSSVKDEKDATVLNLVTATPHVSAIWDATHDGRTAIRGSFNQYIDPGFLALARFTSRSLATKSCFYDEESKAYILNCSTSGGDASVTVGLPDGKEGERVALRAPRTWEFTGGVERELVQGISLGADFIYRKFTHQFEDIETNFVWNEGGTALRGDGAYKDRENHFIFDLETPDAVNRRYQAVTAALRKKEGRLKMFAFYTWTNYQGQQDSSYASDFMDNPKNNVYWYGNLPNDVRHDVRLQGSYQFTSWLSAGATYFFRSGRSYSKWFYNPVYGSFQDLRATQGYDPRNINDPSDDRELRLPDTSLLNLQARANLKKFTKAEIEAWADVFNVLALRTTTSVVNTDNTTFGLPLTRNLPARAVVGLRYRF